MTAALLKRRAGIAIGPLGLPWRPRILVLTLAALVLALIAFVAQILVGAADLTVGDVVSTLLGGGTRQQRTVVLDWRMPRALGGLLVGFALGVAGALTQTFARNPLATPDIIGVTSGASTGAVAAIVLGGGTYAVDHALLQVGVPAAALVGGLAAAAIVYGLSWRSGIDSYRLILVGIGVAAVLTAVTSYLTVIAKISNASQAAGWLVGSLNSTTWDQVIPLTVGVVVITPLALLLTAGLRTSQLGDDTARGLGQRLELHRLLTIVLAVGLSVVAVVAAGPVGFVAFVVPQLALRITRAERPPLLLAGLLGAVLTQGSDLLGRVLFSWEAPVGLVTTVVGAPYLIHLLLRHRKEIAG